MKCGKKINTFRVIFALVWSGQEVKPQCVSSTALIINPDTALPQLLGGELTIQAKIRAGCHCYLYSLCTDTSISLLLPVVLNKT